VAGHAAGVLRLAAAVVAVSLIGLAACAPAQDRWAGLGTPIADPHEPAPPAPSTGTVDGVGGISTALVQEVVAGGGLVRPTEVDCAAPVIVSRFVCEVTYLDQVVTYTVTTEPDPGGPGSRSFTWQSEPDVLVATATGIHAELWRRYADRASAIRCEALPEVRRVPPGEPLAQHCWFKPILSDLALGRDSANQARTVQVDIAITTGGIDLRELTQDR
jgi:hypothetical protein